MPANSAGFKVLHTPGSVRLDGFPRLTYVPRLGEGIRLAADPTVTVARVVAERKAGRSPEQVARDLGLVVHAGTPEEAPNVGAVEEALDYATKAGVFDA
ncbi:hypothetical protein [Tautonia plasticadhaerens]|uniref:Uncharacterized protein n=1 Tax=Tautonia plasticadhaerens TaxID=2527974 RepID=A0A518GZJ7_9BACT|nr:hypothetical protein [Tautonia plasticadhaerens]QDV34019.1 hypothetical protein ElP_19000 [Tautonia plasticadhaerens]